MIHFSYFCDALLFMLSWKREEFTRFLLWRHIVCHWWTIFGYTDCLFVSK